MTLSEAKRLYSVFEADNRWANAQSNAWWWAVKTELEAVVAAKTDRAAGNLIQWWACWDREFTATAWARKVRQEWAKMEAERK
jgi:hypothetical protein